MTEHNAHARGVADAGELPWWRELNVRAQQQKPPQQPHQPQQPQLLQQQQPGPQAAAPLAGQGRGFGGAPSGGGGVRRATTFNCGAAAHDAGGPPLWYSELGWHGAARQSPWVVSQGRPGRSWPSRPMTSHPWTYNPGSPQQQQQQLAGNGLSLSERHMLARQALIRSASGAEAGHSHGHGHNHSGVLLAGAVRKVSHPARVSDASTRTSPFKKTTPMSESSRQLSPGSCCSDGTVTGNCRQQQQQPGRAVATGAALRFELGDEAYASVRAVLVQQQAEYTRQLFELHKTVQLQRLIQAEVMVRVPGAAAVDGDVSMDEAEGSQGREEADGAADGGVEAAAAALLHLRACSMGSAAPAAAVCVLLPGPTAPCNKRSSAADAKHKRRDVRQGSVKRNVTWAGPTSGTSIASAKQRASLDSTATGGVVGHPAWE